MEPALTETDLQQVYQLVKSGKSAEARKFVLLLLQSDPQNTSTWMILVRTYTDKNH